jgi:citrate lyase subunit beta/citryl-CoA lyase
MFSKPLSRCGRQCYHTNIDFRFQVIRSLLFVPGNSEKMLSKILSMEQSQLPDAFVPDLEDSVPVDQKDHARDVTAKFLSDHIKSDKKFLVIPRVNATMGDDVLYKDLSAILSPTVDAVTVGKIETAYDVARISEMLSQVESEKKIQKKIKLIPTIETALGIVNAYLISSSHPDRLIGVAFGADDCKNLPLIL